MNENIIEEIAQFLLQFRGIDMAVFEDGFLKKTLDHRLSVTGKNTYDSYLEYLKGNKTEIETLSDSLYIAFSEFFRNPLTFAFLEQVVLPLVIEKKKMANENELRVWSAACASGQEAYSFAMIFDDLNKSCKTNCHCRIFATDINQAELERAKVGIYHKNALNKVSLRRVQDYFTQKDENFILAPQLRNNIDFSVFDLLAKNGDSPPASIYGNFDLVFCSNVLFYYKPESQIRILKKLSNNLASGGYLITGETERDIVKGDTFREVYANSGIFQKIKYGRRESTEDFPYQYQ
ncbi:MAG: protein-glutamate O-methyltransferase CheR [Bacteroidales bacterium]|nr:protein-glutamate O-methyltransferase CheR [Bacteroidales bacterium]